MDSFRSPEIILEILLVPSPTWLLSSNLEHPLLYLPSLLFSCENRNHKRPFYELRPTPIYTLTRDKMPALSALNSTPWRCLFKDITRQISQTSIFPSTLDLYLQYTLFPLLKNSLDPTSPSSTTLFSLILFTNKKSSEELVYHLLVLFSQLNPFKSVYVFNIPPKPVKKKTSGLTLLYPRSLFRHPFTCPMVNIWRRWPLPARHTVLISLGFQDTFSLGFPLYLSL